MDEAKEEAPAVAAEAAGGGDEPDASAAVEGSIAPPEDAASDTSSFDSSDSDGDEAYAYSRRPQRKLRIEIKPASEATAAPERKPADLRNMISMMRSSVEGLPLAPPPSNPAPAAAPVFKDVRGEAASGGEATQPLSSRSAAPPAGVTAGKASAQLFQEGLACMKAHRWDDAASRFDAAIGGMNPNDPQLKKYWFVAMHHYAASRILARCAALEGAKDAGGPTWARTVRDLMMCARRLRVQAALGVHVSVEAAKAMMRTGEFAAAQTLLGAMGKVLGKYRMESRAGEIEGLLQACAASIDQSVRLPEDAFLAGVAGALQGVRSRDALVGLVDRAVAFKAAS